MKNHSVVKKFDKNMVDNPKWGEQSEKNHEQK